MRLKCALAVISVLAIAHSTEASAAFVQGAGADGIVSINASSANTLVAQGGRSWTAVSPAGHVGNHALQALPNTGANVNTGFETQSPRVDFQIEFNRTGVHHVWIRGIGPSGNDDSVHVGLDLVAQASSDRIEIAGFPTSFGWTRDTMDGVTAFINVQTTGVHTLNVWMREDGVIFDKIVLTSSSFVPTGNGPTQSSESNPPPPPSAFLQGTGPERIVSINASSSSSLVTQGGRSWASVTPSGHVGNHALQALPNTGGNINTGFETQSPRADYQIEFNQTGVHHVWIRGLGPSGNDDSVHVGLDGAAQTSSDRIEIAGFPTSFGWTRDTMDIVTAFINVPTTGLHTLNVWMREDGVVFDKIVLTTASSYAPTGTGPAESAQTTPTLSAPTISPNGGTFSDSVSVTLSSTEPTATIRFTTDGTSPFSSGTAQNYSGSFNLTASAVVRAYATKPGFFDSPEGSATFTITTGGGASAFLQSAGTDGIVSINASSASNFVAQGGRSWTQVTPAGHTGSFALQALPNTGANNNTGFETQSPRADYRIEFNRTGLHHIWIRGIGANGNDDSLHVGLDGVVQDSSDRIELNAFPTSFGWTRLTMDPPTAIIDVPSTGVHTLNVWMREDGVVFDKIVLTTNAGFTPSGSENPAQSSQGMPKLPTPTAVPYGGIFSNQVSVALSSSEPSATIRYTTDGTDPRSSGTASTYGSPFIVSSTQTITATTRLTGFFDSDLRQKVFTKLTCPPTRIMPLGDSITEGVHGPVAAGPEFGLRGGYRKKLYRDLVDGGYSVSFVGSLLGGFNLVPQVLPNHEGHSGWTDDQIAANVYSYLQNNPAQIVLLHIGTNGFETDVSDVADILDEIDRFEADSGQPIVVVLARIINRMTFHTPTSTFNANLQAMAQSRISAGDSIVIVDQESALTYPGDMFDNLHPNNGGYDKMATVWRIALQGLLTPCGA